MAEKWRSKEKSDPQLLRKSLVFNGCPGWDRTSDQVINSHLLCH